MKPVVLLDIDGVAANFIEGSLPVVHEITGRLHVHDDVNQWEISDALNMTPDEKVAYYARVAAAGWCRSLPAYEGAREGVARIREFADVHPLTAHFFTAPTWVHEREAWILEHLDIPARDIIHTHSKHRVAGDVLVEDKPATIVKWLEHHPQGVGVLMRRPYNEGADLPDDSTRVRDWPQLVKWLEAYFLGIRHS
jgi:5'(3')-deoxyribonucleotidase